MWPSQMAGGIDRWTTAGRRAVAGVGLYAVANAFDAAAAFAMIPLITRATPMAVFAQLTLLLAAAGVALVVIDLGCGIALVRQLSTEMNADTRGKLIATSVWLRLAAAGAVGLTSVAISFVVSQPLAEALRLGALAIAVWGMFGGFIEILRGQERHGSAAAALVIKSMTWVTAVMYLVIARDGGLRELVVSYGLAYAVGLAFAVWRTGLRILWSRPDPAIARSLLGFGLPVAGYLGLRTVGGLDRYLVRFRSALEDAAIYQVANVPTAAIEIAERTGVLPAEPYLYGVPREERERALDRILRLTTFVMAAGSVMLAMIGPELVAILGPASYAVALGAIPWFTFAALARAVTRMVALGAALVGKTRVWAIAAAVELLVAAPALYFLLPSWGVTGAAVGRFVAALLALITAYVLLRRVWRVELPIVLICGYMLIGVGAGAAMATASFDLLLPLPARGAAGMALVALGYVVLVRPLKINTRGWRDS